MMIEGSLRWRLGLVACGFIAGMISGRFLNILARADTSGEEEVARFNKSQTVLYVSRCMFIASCRSEQIETDEPVLVALF